MIDNPPLTKDEKAIYLSKFLEKLKDEKLLNLFFEFLCEIIKNDKRHLFADPLQRFVIDLAGPYKYFSNSSDEETHRISYDSTVRTRVALHAVNTYILACQTPEHWSDEAIYRMGQILGIPVLALPYVNCAIFQAKVYWRLVQNGQIIASNEKPAPLNLNYTMMTMEAFISFKNGGRRDTSKRKPQKYFPYFFNGQLCYFDLRRPDRNPRKGSSFSHDDPPLAHACLWDVDTKKALSAHKYKGYELNCDKHDMSENKEDALRFDHIPSSKHILQRSGDPVNHAKTELARIEDSKAFVGFFQYEEARKAAKEKLKGAVKKSGKLKNEGYAIATLSMWHDASRTFKDKNLTDRQDELRSPDKAVRLDILWYFVTLTKNKILTLYIVGAFRYLYKLNVKRDPLYASSLTDSLFNIALATKNGGLDIDKVSQVADEIYKPFLFSK